MLHDAKPYDKQREEQFQSSRFIESATKCLDCGNQLNWLSGYEERPESLYGHLIEADKQLLAVYPDCQHLRLTIEVRSNHHAVR